MVKLHQLMPNLNKFNHIKIHSQYSICEGAVRISDLAEHCKENKIKSVGLSDTTNLCGALEFSENISKSGSHPIIGTQINFIYDGEIGLLPLIAKTETGYKSIIELSSKSYLENDGFSENHCKFEDLLKFGKEIIVLSGSINGLFGKLFNKGKIEEIDQLYRLLKKNYLDDFYIEIQRHDDQDEKPFEIFNLKKSGLLDIPIIATNEVF